MYWSKASFRTTVWKFWPRERWYDNTNFNSTEHTAHSLLTSFCLPEPSPSTDEENESRLRDKKLVSASWVKLLSEEFQDVVQRPLNLDQALVCVWVTAGRNQTHPLHIISITYVKCTSVVNTKDTCVRSSVFWHCVRHFLSQHLLWSMQWDMRAAIMQQHIHTGQGSERPPRFHCRQRHIQAKTIALISRNVSTILKFYYVFLYWYIVHCIHTIKQQMWQPIIFINHFVEKLAFHTVQCGLNRNKIQNWDLRWTWESCLWDSSFIKRSETGLESRKTVMTYLMSL